MIKSFALKNEDLESNIFPNYYLFKQKIKKFSQKQDIYSFSLGDEGVLETLTDGEHAGQKFVSDGAMFIKNSSVKRYSINEFDGFYITHEKNELLKRSKLQKDDILFTTIGYYLGVSALVNSNVENANINQNVVRIRINKKITTPQYLSCFLNSKLVRFQIDNLFSGTYPILTYPKIKAIKIFIKDKSTEKLVTDKVILAEKKNIESLKLIKKAQDLFLKSLDIDFKLIEKEMFYAVSSEQFMSDEMMTPAFYYPLYTKTTKEISKSNHCELLGNLVDFKKGNEVGSINYKKYLDRKESDIPFIRTSDLVNYDIDTYPDFFIENLIYKEIAQNVNKDEILYSKDGKIGMLAMTTASDKCILGSGILRIIPKKDKINPHYLFIALSIKEIGIYQAKQRTVIASTMPHLREDRIGDFSIPILKNQDEIIKLTEKAFKLKDERKILINESRIIIEKSLEI
jgi:type I restriction enzyme S subunit